MNGSAVVIGATGGIGRAMVERIVRAYDADAAKGRLTPDLEDPA